ncbi:tyrosinase family protein [Aspergillus melleus]|uniref:tyrosinase family protein n=1 Tax=Aspergillus melleus TaxID=138277 RepID=UPI001E8DCB4D|nr:uncharacterized protein LDX57_010484 [Aspergillus melleus]KAH8432854.1 hypothetical protein LDX57_010484 [Aspergillus melleus]
MLLVLMGVVGTKCENTCSSNTTTTRQEWGTLSGDQRTEYINAIWCLRNRESVLPSSDYPGVRDRLDDFVATHINYTTSIHDNGVFLPWHRHFLFLWERTLQEECGYTGGVPYWDWSLETSDLSKSPVFDGSATSLSGNGVYDSATCHDNCSSSETSGRRCVTSGPFKDYKIHLGPFNNTFDLNRPLWPPGFDYNPRCLERNLQPWYLADYANKSSLNSMTNAKDINELLTFLNPSRLGAHGAHSGGHFAAGGTMADQYASPQDPAFMLHHGMVDRMWTLWQNGNMDNRRYALNGTAVMHDDPTMPLVTPDFVTEFGPLDQPRALRELMDPMRYMYCYRYD